MIVELSYTQFRHLLATLKDDNLQLFLTFISSFFGLAVGILIIEYQKIIDRKRAVQDKQEIDLNSLNLFVAIIGYNAEAILSSCNDDYLPCYKTAKSVYNQFQDGRVSQVIPQEVIKFWPNFRGVTIDIRIGQYMKLISSHVGLFRLISHMNDYIEDLNKIARERDNEINKFRNAIHYDGSRGSDEVGRFFQISEAVSKTACKNAELMMELLEGLYKQIAEIQKEYSDISISAKKLELPDAWERLRLDIRAAVF